ncbi:MAG: L,D-transpeptidase family protein [Sedimenticola thiotaurini]|uniref:L,D-transpeptidase family protein n=1 Tax=Sedimenticola thiotaurini TaxID=1543721 RepID=A0A558DG22_9GAMM|nr:MAG: L,D-transpeptidase family protein [Sedimenticola thiotaurini]
MNIPQLGLTALLFGLPGSSVALSFPLPSEGNDIVGETREVQTRYEDTFSDIARLNDLGYAELAESNPGVDPWLPGEGTTIVLPARFILPAGPREGIVINLAELRLYYYPKGEGRVITHPLGIGREGWSTPTGSTRIIRKQHKPTWRPPKSVRKEHEEKGDPLPLVVKPGPDNPLGEHALYLSMSGYLIHGTNKPYGVGMRVSHGCIRLYPEDIASLFSQVPVNTPVRIINTPYKAGWENGQLFVEAHPPLSEQREEQGFNFTPMVRAILQAIGEQDLKPDWDAMKLAAKGQRGIPVAVTSAPPTKLHKPLLSPQSNLLLSNSLDQMEPETD